MKRILQILVLTAAVCGLTQLFGQSEQSQSVSSAKGQNCKEDTRVVDSCRWIKGIIAIGNGNPATKIRTKDKRILGVKEDEEPILPNDLADMLSTENEIAGKFYFCPFSKRAKGGMQVGCIEDAKNLKELK